MTQIRTAHDDGLDADEVGDDFVDDVDDEDDDDGNEEEKGEHDDDAVNALLHTD